MHPARPRSVPGGDPVVSREDRPGRLDGRAVPGPSGSPSRATGGLRPATTSSAPNTSSGRTAGVVCRTTAVIIAQVAARSRGVRPRETVAAGAPPGPMRDVGAHQRGPHVDLPAPGRGDPLDDQRVGGEQRVQGRAQRGRLAPRAARSPPAGVDPLGQRRALGDGRGQHVEPGGQRGVQRRDQRGRVHRPGQPDLDVLGLAGRCRSAPRRSRTAAGAG